ncbi:unnamed protein product [Allacma fusca]|uniref:Uncharacterized protein n=1 Tax=Allacma fusca TaxID=39272 RepID=A0A8J2KX73_9HEXA|nr:unnamed protein product [Allacma fusca]
MPNGGVTALAVFSEWKERKFHQSQGNRRQHVCKRISCTKQKVTGKMSRNTEEVDTISVAVAGIDINNVEPLDHKRLVAFMNQFLTTTVSFLNHFSAACEDRLEKIHYKICKIEAQLSILESKLNSCSTTVANSDSNDNSSQS